MFDHQREFLVGLEFASETIIGYQMTNSLLVDLKDFIGKKYSQLSPAFPN